MEIVSASRNMIAELPHTLPTDLADAEEWVEVGRYADHYAAQHPLRISVQPTPEKMLQEGTVLAETPAKASRLQRRYGCSLHYISLPSVGY